MNNPLIELVAFLKEMRLERDWSEADLEGVAGLPAHTVRDYERDPEKLTLEVRPETGKGEAAGGRLPQPTPA